MAIQLRRGTNAEWENTKQNIVAGEPAVALDSERFFVGTGTGTYAEYANVKSIASAYSTTRAYREGDYVMYNGKLYVCTTATTGGAWNAANWEETSLLDAMTSDIPYRNYETTSGSGDIVSFDNGAGGIPVEDLEIEVAATQNMNGYDHPWVGGAGKNLLDNTLCTPRENNGVTRIINSDGTITLNGTSTGVSLFWSASDTMNVRFKAGTYTPSVNVTGMTLRPTFRNAGEQNGTFTLTEDDVLINVRFTNTKGTVFNNTKVSSQIELGSTATAFEPYTNICPISGWDAVNICGNNKNIYTVGSARQTVVSGITVTIDEDGGIHANGQNTGGQKQSNLVYTFERRKMPVGVLLKLVVDNTTALRVAVCYADENGVTINAVSERAAGVYSFTIPKTARTTWTRLYLTANATFDDTDVVHPMVVSEDETDYSFVPHKENRVVYSFGQNVYGGTLDVTSGLLTITHEMFDGGNKTWAKVTGNNYRTFYTGAANRFLYDANTPTVISSNYKSVCNNVGMTSSGDNYVAVAAISGASYVAIKDTSKANMTAEEFKTAMTGVAFVAKLATPQTIQLTPQQVETFLRENNIWADSGRIINCTYRITNT